MFRKKQAKEEQSADGVVALTLPAAVPTATTARLAFAIADGVALSRSPDARLYLVLSDAVNRDGLADEWQFHYMFPSLQAEASLTVQSATAAANGAGGLYVRMTQFPAPGTAEHALAETGGTYMSMVMKQKWEERLERIAPLPSHFVDSPLAVENLSASGRDLFTGGPIRLKGRTLPGGHAVWEVSTVELVFHADFAAN
jgi:hypothetical protein